MKTLQTEITINATPEKERFSKSKTIIDDHDSGKTIKLTRAEQNFIISELDSIGHFCWPENLFPNSKRVNSDSLLWYARYKPVYDSLLARWVNDAYVYGFAKPIYIRNGTLALLLFARMCGGDCGQGFEGFYKYENGKWAEYVMFEHGDF